MSREEANKWSNLRSMLHSLERALEGEVMNEQDIERLEALKAKIEREVMDAQVNTDLETKSLFPSHNPEISRENFFGNWKPEGYNPLS
jgi:hypothetical protein